MLETAAFAWIKVLAQRAVEKTLCVIISERLYDLTAESRERVFLEPVFFTFFLPEPKRDPSRCQEAYRGHSSGGD